MLHELTEIVKSKFLNKATSGIWINEVFFFINANGRINYTIAGKVFTYAHTDKNKFILGYLANQNRLYLADKNNYVFSYELPLVVIKYQAHMIEDEYEEAEALLEKIPETYIDKVAKFLDSLEMKKEAYEIVKDLEFKYLPKFLIQIRFSLTTRPA